MKRRHLSYICLLFALCGVTGCAETIHIPRYNGTFYELSGNKYGNKKIAYSCKLYPDGTLMEESYAYERDIATPAESFLDGFAKMIGAAGDKL